MRTMLFSVLPVITAFSLQSEKKGTLGLTPGVPFRVVKALMSVLKWIHTSFDF